jgi:PhoH-like ATPase
MLQSDQNEKKTAIARFVNFLAPLKPIYNAEDNLTWGVYPKNKEQKCGFDLLMNDDVPFVSLIGRAGSGKTLMAILAGLEQVLGLEGGRYDRIIVSRPVQPMGKDIGFLPGTMEEKILPWLKPLFKP